MKRCAVTLLLLLLATAAGAETLLVPRLSVWSYATGADLGTAWTAPAYDDSGWPAGPGVLGYGDPGLGTRCPSARTPTTSTPPAISGPSSPTPAIPRRSTASCCAPTTTTASPPISTASNWPATWWRRARPTPTTPPALHEAGTYETFDVLEPPGRPGRRHQHPGGGSAPAHRRQQRSGHGPGTGRSRRRSRWCAGRTCRWARRPRASCAGAPTPRPTAGCATAWRPGSGRRRSPTSPSPPSTRSRSAASSRTPGTTTPSATRPARWPAASATTSSSPRPCRATRKPTRVWVIGDSGTANANAAAVRTPTSSTPGPAPTDLWLMLGDNAYTTGTDAEYQAAVFDMYPRFLQQCVLWPTLGNHDALHAGRQQRLLRHLHPADGAARPAAWPRAPRPTTRSTTATSTSSASTREGSEPHARRRHADLAGGRPGGHHPALDHRLLAPPALHQGLARLGQRRRQRRPHARHARERPADPRGRRRRPGPLRPQPLLRALVPARRPLRRLDHPRAGDDRRRRRGRHAYRKADRRRRSRTPVRSTWWPAAAARSAGRPEPPGDGACLPERAGLGGAGHRRQPAAGAIHRRDRRGARPVRDHQGAGLRRARTRLRPDAGRGLSQPGLVAPPAWPSPCPRTPPRCWPSTTCAAAWCAPWPTARSPPATTR